jgi:hypothetical protein
MLFLAGMKMDSENNKCKQNEPQNNDSLFAHKLDAGKER